MMVAANTYGRQVVIPLTNKSGGAIAAGDVVIVDTSNNDAFTTTTSAGFSGGIGIAQETIANNATGRVLTQGYAALVNVNASVTRGNFGKTHTVAKQATDAGSSRGTGTFCQFLTGGTTPDALVYPVDLGAATLGALASASYKRTSGNYTISSTSFADIDGTNTNFTITTGARRVMCTFSGAVRNNTAGFSLYIDVELDGARLGGADAGIMRAVSPSNNFVMNGSFTYITDALSAGSHTFKFQARVDGNTGLIFGDASGPSDTQAIGRFSVVELYA